MSAFTGTPEQIAKAEAVREQVVAMIEAEVARGAKSRTRAHELGRLTAEQLQTRNAQHEQAAAAVLAYPEAHLWISMSIYGVLPHIANELRKIEMTLP